MKGLHYDERGVEPTAMKILAGVILLAIGLGIGVTVYLNIGSQVTAMQCTLDLGSSSKSIARPASGVNSETVNVTVTLTLGDAENATLSATGAPAVGVSVQFTPETGVPTFYSTMTVSVYDTLGDGDLGAHTLTVKATDGDGRQCGSASFSLTITA